MYKQRENWYRLCMYTSSIKEIKSCLDHFLFTKKNIHEIIDR